VSDALSRQAVVDRLRWLRELDTAYPISVNITARELLSPGFAARVKDSVLRQRRLHGIGEVELPMSAIEFEIVESTAILDMSRAADAISELGKEGVRFSLDDFGTGYSSFGYLKAIPVHGIKIDRSFVSDLGSCDKNCQILQAFLGVAQVFGIETLAEGVETTETAIALRQLGVRYGQGYGIARPMPASAVGDWVRHWREGAFKNQLGLHPSLPMNMSMETPSRPRRRT
jgi:EAL domain-containing protein (putative c-di-GMP-specific phosphodiesterase class I)